MIQFNELQITSDGRYIIINVSVKDLEYYTDVFIDQVLIDTQDTYSTTAQGRIYQYIEYEDNKKELKLVIDSNSIPDLDNFNNKLIFVTVVTKGTPKPNTPCGLDNIYTTKATYNRYPIYTKSIEYCKELSNTCSIPKNFIDYILKLKVINLCIKSQNFTKAINYWNKYFLNLTNTINSNCLCH